MLNLERADTGTFSFRAENDHGSAECSTEINVMVPPGKPKVHYIHSIMTPYTIHYHAPPASPRCTTLYHDTPA